MAFDKTNLAPNQSARSSDVLQVINALDGTANYGQPITLNKLSSNSAYALDVQNLGTGGGLRVKTSGGSTVLDVTDAGVAFTLSAITVPSSASAAPTGEGVMEWDSDDNLLKVGDGAATKTMVDLNSTQTLAAKTLTAPVLTGAVGTPTALAMDQSTADTAILTLASTGDVTHGMTTVAPTAVYGQLAKIAGADGGLFVQGLSDATIALSLTGYATTEDTTHTVAGRAAVIVQALKANGTGTTTLAADGNLFAILDANGATQFIVDAEGNYFSNDTGSTYDAYDDLALVSAFDLRQDFAAWRDTHRPTLEAAGILAPADAAGNPGHVNWGNLARLHNGAIRQMAVRLDALEARLPLLEGAN